MINDFIGSASSSQDNVDAKARNPVFEFKMDYYTAFPNSLGIPSITLPVQETWGKDPVSGLFTSAYKFPSSIKICTYFGEDYHLLRVARQMQHMLEENMVSVDAH
jgi:Asp-tRNA(Asn)/Glu-tRNA(Gln) amidotransferase A subunit family amidase